MSGPIEPSSPARGVLTPLDRAECLTLLATRPIGRLVFTYRALPDVLPVNYVLDGESVIIRLGSGSTAATATRDSVVAFEVDDVDVSARIGWSVIIVGRAEEITDLVELRAAQVLGLVPWAGDWRDHFIRISMEKLTGRRLDRSTDRIESPDASVFSDSAGALPPLG